MFDMQSLGEKWQWFVRLPVSVYVGFWIVVGFALPYLVEWLLAINGSTAQPFHPSVRAASTVISTVLGLYVKSAKEIDDHLMKLPETIRACIESETANHSNRALASMHLSYRRDRADDVSDILIKLANFVEKTENLTANLHAPAYNMVRSEIDDLQRLFSLTNPHVLPIYRAVELYRAVSVSSTSLCLIERVPMNPAAQWSPDFVAFIEDLRRRENFQLSCIICCPEEELEKDFTGAANIKAMYSQLFDSENAPLYWSDQGSLLRMGADDVHHLNCYLTFDGAHGRSVVCSRPPSEKGFEKHVSVALISRKPGNVREEFDFDAANWIRLCIENAKSSRNGVEVNRVNDHWLKAKTESYQTRRIAKSKSFIPTT